MLTITPCNNFNKSRFVSFGIVGGKGIKKKKKESIDEKINYADEKLSMSEKFSEKIDDLKSIKSRVFSSNYDKVSEFYENNNYDYDATEAAIRNNCVFKKNKIKQLNKLSAKTENEAQNEQEALIKEKAKSAEEAQKIAKEVKLELIPEKPEATLKRCNDITNVDEVEMSFDKLEGFKKIAGYEDTKELLQINVIDLIKREQAGEEVDVPGSILFFGPTQNGKTTFANAFAEETGCKIIELRTSGRPKEKYQKFIHGLSEEVSISNEHFDKTHQRTIIIADEFDSIFGKDKEKDTKALQLISDLNKNSHCTLFATTNYPDRLGLANKNDEQLFPIRVGIEPPSLDNKIAILNHYGEPRAKEKIDYEELGNILHNKQVDGNYTVSQIRSICKESHRKNPSGITTDILKSEIENTKPAITKEEIDKFNSEVKELILEEEQ